MVRNLTAVPVPAEFGAAGEVVGKAFGHEVGLGIDLDPCPQRILKNLFHQGVMGAAQDRGLGVGHPAFQRLDMAADQRLGQDLVALFDGIDHTAAGLRLDIDADGAEGEFALKGAARRRWRGWRKGRRA